MRTHLAWCIGVAVVCNAAGAGYDPLVTGPKAQVIDLDIRINDDREIPVRIFLPADSEPAPVVLFSHGLGGSRETSNFLAAHWASRGYVCVFLQHPGSDVGVWRGKNPAAAMEALKSAASARELLVRIGDVKGVLDGLTRLNASTSDKLSGRLNLDRIGMSGHSFGAMTTQAVGGQRGGRPSMPRSEADPRIDAALPMSPSPAKGVDAEFSFGEVGIPWLLMTGTEDGAPSGIVDIEPSDRLKVYPSLPAGEKYELVLDNGEHMAFTEGRMRFQKSSQNPNHHRVILATSTAFWDSTLRGDQAAGKWLREHARTVMEAGDRWQWK